MKSLTRPVRLNFSALAGWDQHQRNLGLDWAGWKLFLDIIYLLEIIVGEHLFNRNTIRL